MGDNKKVLRKDQGVLIGVAGLIVGFMLGMISYHLIIGVPAAPVVAQSAPSAPPSLSPPGNTAPNYSSQIEEVKKILAKDPQNYKGWVELGNMLFDSGRHQESVDAYSSALKLKGNDPNVLTDRGIMYRELGDYQSAVADFRRAAQADPTHYQSLLNLGITLLHNMDDATGAVKAWEEMLEKRNPPPDVVLSLQDQIKQIKELIAQGKIK